MLDLRTFASIYRRACKSGRERGGGVGGRGGAGGKGGVERLGFGVKRFASQGTDKPKVFIILHDEDHLSVGQAPASMSGSATVWALGSKDSEFDWNRQELDSSLECRNA